MAHSLLRVHNIILTPCIIAFKTIVFLLLFPYCSFYIFMLFALSIWTSPKNKVIFSDLYHNLLNDHWLSNSNSKEKKLGIFNASAEVLADWVSNVIFLNHKMNPLIADINPRCSVLTCPQKAHHRNRNPKSIKDFYADLLEIIH